MAFVTCLTIAFIAGFAVARKLTLRKVASSVIIAKSQPVPSSATSPAAKASTRSYIPQKTYRDSRWQERDELFQGMVAEGILLERKEWLITRCEKCISIIWKMVWTLLSYPLPGLSGALDQLSRTT